jgi:hypothetical protein
MPGLLQYQCTCLPLQQEEFRYPCDRPFVAFAFLTSGNRRGRRRGQRRRRKKKTRKKKKKGESKAFACFARSNANASTAFDSSFLMLLSIQELRVHKICEQELVAILQTAPRLLPTPMMRASCFWAAEMDSGSSSAAQMRDVAEALIAMAMR